jgi:L-ascorbate oxidase
LLTFTEGNHYWVRVYNDLPDKNTTIHFHGFSQFTTPFSDGTPLASQWPIPPGHFFDYEFQLEDGFYGTYWLVDPHELRLGITRMLICKS